MFGHQDDNNHDQKPEDEHAAAQQVAPDQPVGHDGQGNDGQGQDGQMQDGQATDYTAQSDSAGDDSAWQNPGEPMDEQPGPINDIVAPAGGNAGHMPPMPPAPHHASDDDSGHDDDDARVPHELIDIKQKALGKLSPLVDKLDQTPEERFRTIMMMIQASDDQHLVKEAYEAANRIEDEKVRAQALLDVVNEINYFTQHPQPESQPE